METVIEACRLCAKLYANPKELEFVHLFEPYKGLENEMQFILTLLKVWQVEVQAGDGLPQRICANCFDSFCNIDVFRQECQNAQQTLLQYFVDANGNDLKLPDGTEQSAVDQSFLLPLPPSTDCSTDLSTFMMPPAEPNATATATSAELNTEQTNDVLPASLETPTGFNTFDFQNNNQTDGQIKATSSSSSNTTQPSEVLNIDAMELLENLTPSQMYFEDTAEAVELPDNTQQQQPIELALNAEPEQNTVVNEVQDLEDMLESSVIPKVPPQTPLDNTSTPNIISTKRVRVGQFPAATPTTEPLHDDDVSNDLNSSSPTTVATGNPLACQYCYCHSSEHVTQLIYPGADALSQHYFDVHDPNLPYNCPYCTESFKSQKPRDYHVSEAHRSVLPVTECEYCHKVIRTTNEMHQYCCTYVSDWHCNVCDEHFPNMPLSSYRAHQRQHKSTKQHRCRHCGREFVRRANLEAHERTHRVEPLNMVQCSSCKATFRSDYELKRHKYQVHSGEMPVKCEYCAKGFASIAFYNRHMQHLHPDKLNDPKLANSTTCNNCNQKFSSVIKLRYHLQRPRDENGNCTPSITEMLNDEKKEKRRARNEGLFPCPHCSKRFFMKSLLEKHLKTHDASLRPYQCDQCYVRCRNSSELQEHVNVAHLNIKVHECKTCGKRFGYKKDLYNHELFHAELKIHCKEVGCNFICRSDKALNDHIRQNHRPVPCEYCGTTFTRQRLLTHLRTVHSDEIQNDVAEMELVNNNRIDYNNSKMDSAAIINNNDIIINNNNSNNNNNNNNEANNVIDSIVNVPDDFMPATNMEVDQYFLNNVV